MDRRTFLGTLAGGLLAAPRATPRTENQRLRTANRFLSARVRELEAKLGRKRS